MSARTVADVLAMHQVRSSGMTYRTPDECTGARTLPAAGEEDVRVRRSRAFAERQAEVLAAQSALTVTPERVRTARDAVNAEGRSIGYLPIGVGEAFLAELGIGVQS